MLEEYHTSVMLKEAIKYLSPYDDYKSSELTSIHNIDATFGRGGHTRQWLKKMPIRNSSIIAIDKDYKAIDKAIELFKNEPRVIPYNDSFHNIKNITKKLWGDDVSVDSILMDLGVSFPQLSEADRGFSFMQDGPLDMRMDIRSDKNAYDLINNETLENLSDIFYKYGEEKFSYKLAKAIVKRRNERGAIESTKELASIIYENYPKKYKLSIHPATRVFQAIRIWVNDEITHLQKGLEEGFSILKIGGRVAIISFHSIEDRVVKNFVNQKLKAPIYPKELIYAKTEIFEPSVKWVCKLLRPSENEVSENPRSRSAKLRVYEKIK